MKHYKRLIGLVLALVMTAALAGDGLRHIGNVDYRPTSTSSQIIL